MRILSAILLYGLLPYFGGMILWYAVMVEVRGKPTNDSYKMSWNDNFSRFWMATFWPFVTVWQLGPLPAYAMASMIHNSRSLLARLIRRAIDHLEQPEALQQPPRALQWMRDEEGRFIDATRASIEDRYING